MFFSAGDVTIDAHDVVAAQRWYSEKLGLSYSSVDAEDVGLELGYSPDSIVVYLAEISDNARPNRGPGRPPTVFAKKLVDAHQYLSTQGVDVGPIQSDSGGNQFFRFRDLEGNELEVCQEN